MRAIRQPRRTNVYTKVKKQPSRPLTALEREMQLAREIQASFLVKEIPQPPGWEIAARFEPALQVAGDFYDVFPLVENRRLGLVIADVSGKGVGAALFMALVRSLVRALAQQHYAVNWRAMFDENSPNRHAMPHIGAMALQNAVKMTNDYIIANHNDASMFATLFFGVLDPATGVLMYINAGHNPPILASATSIKAKVATSGPAIGILPDALFEVQHAQLDPGDLLLCYTDGVTEARSAHDEFFDEERLDALVAQPATSAEVMLDRVMSSVQEFAAGAEQSDDITLLVARRIESVR